MDHNQLDEIVKQFREHVQPTLKYFEDPSARLSEEELKKVVYQRYNIQNYKLDMQVESKINTIIKEGYKDYLDMCNLIDKGMSYSYYDKESKDGKDRTFKTSGYHGCVECRFMVRDGLYSIRLIPPKGHSVPIFESPGFSNFFGQEPLNSTIMSLNTELTFQISNSLVEKGLIEQSKEINKYSLKFGNNPILLSIIKGWNHTCTHPHYNDLSCDGNYLVQQKDVIHKLLERKDLDVNCIDLKYGMTPLHIACLRGDSLELIQNLLGRGANPDAADYQGNRPIDLLCYEYKKVQEIITDMIGKEYKFGKDHAENKSIVATLPTREEREKNIKKTRALFIDSREREEQHITGGVSNVHETRLESATITHQSKTRSPGSS